MIVMATQKKDKKAAVKKAKPATKASAIATPDPEPVAPAAASPEDKTDQDTPTADPETEAPNEVEAPNEDPESTDSPAESETVEQLCELADKDTGFYDHETGFKVVRDQRMPLGDRVGKATRTAIVSGRLLVVGGR